MKNTAAKMIITILSLVTIVAILAGLYIHVFGGGGLSFTMGTTSDSITFGEDVKDVYIEIDAAKVNVKEGDKLSVDYRLPGNEAPVVDMQDGRLTVKSMKKGAVMPFSFGDELRVDVTLPEETKLDSFELRLDAGEVSVGSFDADRFSIISDAGNIEIDDMDTGTFEIQTDAGNIGIEKLVADRATIKLDAGNVSISESTIDTIEAKLDAGNMEVEGSEIAHGSCESDLGNIELDGNIGDVTAKTSLGHAAVNGR